MLRFELKDTPFVFLAVVIAFTIHEFAHAYAADKFGDPTPRSMGRVTLNPRVHLDVLGTILIFLIGFGWAKPVLVNRGNFKRPRLMGIIVSVVGPLSNLIIAFIGLFILFLLGYFGWLHELYVANYGVWSAITTFLGYLISLNVMLFLFNLLPLPPLDGYRIVQDLLPVEQRIKLQQYEQWAIYFFLLMVFLPPLYNVFLGPYLSLQEPIQNVMLDIARAIFGRVALS
ncbi:site-2 protease family protein [Paenibacillus psychroresistens]|uniref:Site-2 protease family protein n=1 Tax=Paenibacillus psychroresistens TaxID=1778678 RepID=A0A6B8RWB4_9BACL|nr:site-2 protease family protein [Paenibacillus psychroresistens]